MKMHRVSAAMLCVAACSDPSAALVPGVGSTLSDLNYAGHGSDDKDDEDDKDDKGRRDIEHVLLLSIDGMHQRDLKDFVSSHPDSALAQLSQRGVDYDNAYVNRLDGKPTNPSDSFPGLLALTTGGSSPSHGGWYDVSYARELFPYNEKAPCSGAPGVMVSYDESIELDADSGFGSLWGSTSDNTPTHDPVVVRSRLDKTKLPYKKTGRSCEPVFPHQYIRVNTIFEVAHAAGKHTAWSDKHLAYELVTGPSGSGLDDFFAPEINSVAKNLVSGAPDGDDYTTRYTETEVYDDFKVHALLNQIDGKWSDDGLQGASDVSGPAPGVPAIFGMNFQALSVAQKNAKSGAGGYDASGAPKAEVSAALAHTDASIGRLVMALKTNKLLASTLVIVTAKHGQSPINPDQVHKIDGDAVAKLVDAAAPVVGHIEDDVALYWLKNPNDAAAARAALIAGSSTVNPSVDQVFTRAQPQFLDMFGDPQRDPRTPDVVVQPKVGVIYSLSAKKLAEHGGFADDDAHVALLISNPQLSGHHESSPVRTQQVAPTILQALGLPPHALEAVRKEGTTVLPGLDL